MNYQKFNQSGGFPIKTQTLEDMQLSWQLLNSLGEIAGNFTILKGCEESNGTVSDGVVYINGEVLDFVGGMKGTTVIITETAYKREFKDGSNKDVLFIRKVMFGIGSVTFNWADFKRPKSTVQLTKDKAEQTELEKLIQRVQQLEARPTANVPIGMIAIWDRPANEIPVGWVEYQPLRGRMPIGLDPNYTQGTDTKNYNLNTLNVAGGDREHKIMSDELPIDLNTNKPYQTGVTTSDYLSKSQNNKAFSLMNPYRVVHFIQYKGV